MISDWGDLQTILAISSEGSLSGAARKLGVNQSTASRRLQSIERELNRPVFFRGADGRFRPNETGERLIETARLVQAVVDEANFGMAGTPAPIRIASCEVLSQAFAAPALARWAEVSEKPVDLSIYDNLFTLPPDEFDVMITPLESAPEEMVGRCIGRLDWGLYASPAYLAGRPLRPDAETLAGHLVISAAGSLADIAAYRWLAELGGTSVFRASSVMTQRDMAANGAGIALLPTSVILPTHGLVPLESMLKPSPSDVWMVARRATAGQPRVRRFLDWAGKHFRQAPSPDRKAG